MVFKVLVESQAGRSLSWGELFDATSRAGVLWFLEVGVLVQADFAAIAGIGAFLLRGGRTKAAVPMMIVGVFALIFSIAIFGGILGLIGGALSIAGGAKGRARAPPAFTYPPYGYGPPPNPPPPPYRP